MILALSGFLFEDNYASQSLDFREFCALAKSIGCKGVDLRRTQVHVSAPKSQRNEILKIADDHGLHIVQLTVRGPAEANESQDDFFSRHLELCSDLRCGLLKVGGAPDWLKWAAEKAQSCGVAIACNNHINTPLESVEGTRRIFSAVNHPNFGLLYDCLHLFIKGEKYLSCIPEFAPLARNILVHSARIAATDEHSFYAGNGVKWAQALPTEPGVQNWKEVFKQFKLRKYNGLVTIFESGWPVDQREFVARHCARILRRLWESVS